MAMLIDCYYGDGVRAQSSPVEEESRLRNTRQVEQFDDARRQRDARVEQKEAEEDVHCEKGERRRVDLDAVGSTRFV